MTVDLRDLAQPGDFITAERWNEMQLAIYGHIRDEVAALQAKIGYLEPPAPFWCCASPAQP